MVDEALSSLPHAKRYVDALRLLQGQISDLQRAILVAH
jgi:hypothetical protein